MATAVNFGLRRGPRLREFVNLRQAQLLELQAAALEAAGNAILITDREAMIVWANSAFQPLTGYTNEKAMGENARLLILDPCQPRSGSTIALAAWRWMMTSVKKRWLLALLVWSFACLPALAQDEQSGGTSGEFVEPIVTEETLPNEVGDWDLRLSCGYTHQDGARTADCVRAQVFFGIARRWGGEVDLPLTYAMDTPSGHGLGDFSAAIKYRVRAPKPRVPAVVLGLESTFPTGDASKGTGEGVYELRPNLAFLQKIGRTTLQGNLGCAVALAKGTAEASNQGTFNGSAAFPLRTKQWYLLAEATGTFATNSRQMLLAPGIKYTFRPNRFLALGLPVGITANSPAFGVIVQMQFSIREHREHEQTKRAID